MLLSEFKQNDQGGSCLLSGRRYSGKTMMLNHVLKQLFPDDGKKDGIRFETIDGNDYNNFASTTKLFDQLGLGAMVEKQRDFEFEQWGKDVKNNKATTPKKSSKSATPKKTKTNIIPDDGEMEQRIEKILFLVDHFENFAKKYNQNFLYGILNGSQSFPWFVILVGTSEVII
jgi:Cdc6-like AAA superfamily ATPase